MQKLSTPQRLGPWALTLAFLCLSAALPASADGVVDRSTAVCNPCSASNDGYGPISLGQGSGVGALCTISGSVGSIGTASGYWDIEYYTLWSESYASSANVDSDAHLYGIYYGMGWDSSGSADCSGNSSGIVNNSDGYDYGTAATNSGYFG
ncbi:MAG: hypothetical protein JO307_25290 [Bryobacterales bacterium]|nr:hypothetical protein [Bryobacterales bacterium]MBV9401090.1 hypothetical protein [Bryobacterales bacterium]